MAFKCGFFNSINGDRKYNADDMLNPIKGIVSDGVVADDLYSDGLQVQAHEGLEIVVKKGYGKFHNKWCENDADLLLTVPTPHVTNTRIDSIIIKIDLSDEVRNGFLEYRQGTTVAPELERNNSVMEYRLANITVAPNVTEITQANIEDTRPSAECGFVSNLLQNSDISATYSQWKNQFNSWFNESQEKSVLMQNENQEQFDSWFENLKETVSTATLISSYSSRYITEQQDETNIPIGITKYNSVVDILQVYINGLLLVEGFDYVVLNFNEIKLTNGVDAGTQISFVVYKSIDGTGAESIIGTVEELEQKTNDLQSRVETLESKTDEALWTGADVMGAGATITPNKKLSECKNGWILVWSDYDETTGVANNSQVATVVVPKQIAPTNSFYCIIPSGINANGTVTSCGKSLGISNTSITGYAGNNATTDGQDVCLKAVYEY